MPFRPDRRRRTRIEREADAWHARMLEPSSEAEVDAFEDWLNADPAHPRAYAEVEANSTRAERLRRRLLFPANARGFALRPAFGVALAVLVATGAVLWVSGGAPSAAKAAISNPGPGVRSVRLQDGSRVQLDSGAAVSVLLDPDVRRVRLRTGRARFTVAPDPARAFLVTARAVTIRAERGVFDVAATAGPVRVQVLEGAVSVTPGRAPVDRASLTLHRGQALDVGDGGVAARAAPDPEIVSWPDSRVGFSDTPLAQVVAMANRDGRPRIVLQDERIGALKVSGVLDIRDTASLARKLAAALDLRVDQRSDAVLLTR